MWGKVIKAVRTVKLPLLFLVLVLIFTALEKKDEILNKASSPTSENLSNKKENLPPLNRWHLQKTTKQDWTQD